MDCILLVPFEHWVASFKTQAYALHGTRGALLHPGVQACRKVRALAAWRNRSSPSSTTARSSGEPLSSFLGPVQRSRCTSVAVGWGVRSPEAGLEVTLLSDSCEGARLIDILPA